MTDAKAIMELVDKITEAAKAEDGYAYATGWLRSTLVSAILGYVPVANRVELVKEMQQGLDYLESIKKVEA
jgi:hypothetical protein